MGEDSAISWTHHTFNPWWGCSKVSPACAHCYAETWSKRTGFDSLWKGERRFFGDKHWNDPIRWNKAAAAAGERRRVFCASMADVFEDREDLVPHRARLFDLIRRTPNLDWLLLTKRPENIVIHMKQVWHQADDTGMSELRAFVKEWLQGTAPANVWIGTTVENQEMAEQRIPALLSVPARVRFLSCEPLLGPVDLAYTCFNGADSFGQMPGIGWVICGGESGANARPMHPDWARALRDQCAAAKVPFHFKQWGEWVPDSMLSAGAKMQSHCRMFQSGKITDILDKDSNDLNHALFMGRVGTKRAGRLLDGVLHDAFPPAI